MPAVLTSAATRRAQDHERTVPVDLEQITLETLEAVKKAQTSGLTSGTGITGVNLAGLISLIPVETPFRNMLPRVQASEGAKFATWRALLNVNNQQPNPAIAY